MPTASDTALSERDLWIDLSSHWDRPHAPDVWADRPPTEGAVVVFYDPIEDLRRRAREWGHELLNGELGSLAAFAAGLAETEAESWASEARDVATRAYETRRHLVGDRLIHWAVPWLDTVGHRYPTHRETAHRNRDALLTLGDEMRLAPRLRGREGLMPQGEDSYGPVEPQGGERWLHSLWSGAVILNTAISSADEADNSDLAVLFESAARRWRRFAQRYPGTAQFWDDLAARARHTADSVIGMGAP